MAVMEQPINRQTEPHFASTAMIEAGLRAYNDVTLFHDFGQRLTGDELAIICLAMVAER